MSFADLAVIGVILAVLSLAMIKILRDRKRNKAAGGGCSCSGCPMGSSCDTGKINDA